MRPALLGRPQWSGRQQPSLGAEDFAELQRETPSTMFRLGVAGPNGCTPLHSNTFAADEASCRRGRRGLERESVALVGAGRGMTPMSRLGRDLLACSTLLLVVLGLLGVLLRQGPDRLQSLPALLIGLALLLQSAWSWRRRRRSILGILRDEQ